MRDSALLSVRGLQVSYGAVQALRGVDLDIAAGEIVTLIGANGAGKSTLMRAISGLVPAKGGTAKYAGRPLDGVPAHRRVALGIAQSPEGRQVFADQSVQDNLLLGAYLRRGSDPSVASDLEFQFTLFPRLKERRHQSAGTLSGGEQQMLAIGRALMTKPTLLLLDEPSLGLAPLVVKEIFAAVHSLKNRGLAVLLVEQMANHALRIADRAYILKTGSISPSRRAADLLNDPAVQDAYLGLHS
jgi:branched-chain amino acid transport system ATP-binding protein